MTGKGSGLMARDLATPRRVALNFPLFFLSHASPPAGAAALGDDDELFVRFFLDLERVTAHALDVDRPSGIGYMARAGADPGEVYHALGICQIFIPLWSPLYFKTESCGRQWAAFQARARKAAVPPETRIMPVTWVSVHPSAIPPVALRSDRASRRGDRADVGKGLYALLVREEFDQYDRVVDDVAAAVVRAVDAEPLPESALTPIGVQSVFTPEGTRLSLRIVIMAPTVGDPPVGRHDLSRYGRSALDWTPYGTTGQDFSLAEEVVDLAARLGYETEVVAFDEVAEEMLAGRPSDHDPATLLLIDNWALLDGRRRPQVEACAGLNRPWYRCMVIRDPDDPETFDRVAELRQAVRATLGTRLDSMRVDLRFASSGAAPRFRFRDNFSLLAQAAMVGFIGR